MGVWDNLTGEYIPDGYPSPPLSSGYGGYDERNYKICPECGNTVNLDAESCYMCGHVFEVENYYKQCPVCNRMNSLDAEICALCSYEFNRSGEDYSYVSKRGRRLDYYAMQEEKSLYYDIDDYSYGSSYSSSDNYNHDFNTVIGEDKESINKKENDVGLENTYLGSIAASANEKYGSSKEEESNTESVNEKASVNSENDESSQNEESNVMRILLLIFLFLLWVFGFCSSTNTDLGRVAHIFIMPLSVMAIGLLGSSDKYYNLPIFIYIFAIAFFGSLASIFFLRP